MRYRRKVEEVDAFHWEGQPSEEWPPFMFLTYLYRGNLLTPALGSGDTLAIPGPSSMFVAKLGMWVVRGPEGTLFTMRDDSFPAFYEAIPVTVAASGLVLTEDARGQGGFETFGKVTDDSHP